MSKQFGMDIYEIRGGRKITPDQLMRMRDPTPEITMMARVALRTSAERYRNYVQQFVKGGGVTPALSFSTTQVRSKGRGGHTPMYDTGAMINSLEIKQIAPMTFVVGLPMRDSIARPSVPWKSSHSNITSAGLAMVNLKARKIRVTHQMAKFFKWGAAEGIFPYWFMYINRGETINIPARPFMAQATKNADAILKPVSELTATMMSQYMANFFSLIRSPLQLLWRAFKR